MKFYKCNNCGEGYCVEKIELRGFASSQGDILLPGGSDKHFCSRDCLIVWIEKETKDIENHAP